MFGDEIDTTEKTKSQGKEKILIDSSFLNKIGLMGDVNEENANEIVFSLLLQNEKLSSDYIETILNLTDEEVNSLSDAEFAELKPNIEFYISTNGGSANEMFAIYDVINKIKSDKITSISTIGIGKVMSAGVLLLASGSKGRRKIGRNCRVMIHSVIAGTSGPMHQLENEFEEVRSIQESYIKALAAETSMSEKKIKKLLKKKTNIYLSAEEAIELGIADEIL